MNEVVAFVRDSLAAGQSREAIREVLAEAGWKSDEIADALSRFSDSDFPVPVPRKKASGWARDAFLYLVTFAALYTTAVALGALLFGVVDHSLPDTLQDRNDYGSPNDGLRWSIASIVVTFPLYLALTRKHLLDYAKDAARRNSPVRNWLTYLTLYLMAMVEICSFISVIGNVLGGEIASRFILKAMVVIVIAGAIFLFYLWDIRGQDRDHGNGAK